MDSQPGRPLSEADALLIGLVGIATAYTLFLLVPALAGRPGQERRAALQPPEDRTKP